MESLAQFIDPNIAIPLSILILLVVGYIGSPLIVWTIAGAFAMLAFGASQDCWIIFAVVAIIFNIKPIRKILVSSILMKVMAPIMPKISATERTALDAGVVWVETDLFSGKPNFKKIMSEPYARLTPEEKAFMENQCATLAQMIDPWKVWKTREFEQKVWDYIKKEKFFGMIIPKEYGGLGFSAMAHSEVVHTLSARSLSVGVTVMVPNSLGPAELLIHYGTEEQKKHWLPRLATGQEIPCFGLTEPLAGSDAGSITSSGELFKGDDGKLYIKLNWNKRWITLAAISTVLGLAFRLRDPKNLLGKGEDVGITCALVPASTPGVDIGKRHDPLGAPFYNCPTRGKDVIVPIDAVVGAESGCGIGWMMLMECLAAGRGISLPAQATGGSKLITRVTSAHAVVRQQFGVSIGKFEGVEEPLARIFGTTYGLEAMRRFTLGALDKGIKPPVITAIAKYWGTELGRRNISDGMDIMGGAGISLGRRNTIAEMWIANPIGITVEGANIMTRTLIIFGQGALRAHPYAYKEVKTIEEKDLTGFDGAFWGHIGHIVRNSIRSVLLSLSRGYIASTPDGPLRAYYRRLSWASASFAIMADVAMGTLGGSLKFREKVTGRFADILSWMYMASATLRRFEDEGRRKEDLAAARYMLKMCFFEIQKAFDGLFDNMYAVEQKSIAGKLMFGFMKIIFKDIIGMWSRFNSIGSQGSDHLQHALVTGVLENPAQRDHLTEGLWRPTDRHNEQLARLDYAMEMVHKAEVIEKKVRTAVKKKTLEKRKGPALFEDAKAKGVITDAEHKLWKESYEVRFDAIMVDEFTQEEYLGNKA